MKPTRLNTGAIGALALAALLSACAASAPSVRASYGDPRPLMQLVLSDQVAPNTPLPAEPVGDTRWPPLCLLIDYVSTETAIVHLLNRGADINGPCSSITPLDILRLEIVSRAADTAPGRRSVYSADQAAFLMGRAERMIANGARLSSRTLTFVEFQEAVARDTEKKNAMVATMRQEAAQKQMESWFTAENLAAAAQAAGSVANNYAASKGVSAVPATNSTPRVVATAARVPSQQGVSQPAAIETASTSASTQERSTSKSTTPVAKQASIDRPTVLAASSDRATPPRAALLAATATIPKPLESNGPVILIYEYYRDFPIYSNRSRPAGQKADMAQYLRDVEGMIEAARRGEVNYVAPRYEVGGRGWNIGPVLGSDAQQVQFVSASQPICESANEVCRATVRWKVWAMTPGVGNVPGMPTNSHRDSEPWKMCNGEAGVSQRAGLCR